MHGALPVLTTDPLDRILLANEYPESYTRIFSKCGQGVSSRRHPTHSDAAARLPIRNTTSISPPHARALVSDVTADEAFPGRSPSASTRICDTRLQLGLLRSLSNQTFMVRLWETPNPIPQISHKNRQKRCICGRQTSLSSTETHTPPQVSSYAHRNTCVLTSPCRHRPHSPLRSFSDYSRGCACVKSDQEKIWMTPLRTRNGIALLTVSVALASLRAMDYGEQSSVRASLFFEV